MYNSLFVSLIIKIYRFIACQYDKSLLKRIVDALKRGFSYLSEGSRFKSIFTSRDSMIEKSFIYSLYSRFMKFLNKLIGKIRGYISENGKYSIAYKNIRSLFKTKTEVFRTFFVFTLSFGLMLLIGNMIRGYYSGRSYIVAIISVFISIIGLTVRENYRAIIENSLAYRFIYNIFSLEEGTNFGN